MPKRSSGNSALRNLPRFIKLKRKDIIVYSFLGIIVAVGAFLRLRGISDGSFPFTYDIGRDFLEVEKIATFQKIPLIGPTTGLIGLFYGPWWYYFLAIPFFVTSGDPVGVAYFFALVGIATIVLGFFLGKKLSGSFLGLLFATLISASAGLVAEASHIWSPTLIPILVVLVFFVLCNVFVNQQKRKSWFILGILFGFIINSGIIFGLLFLVSVLASFTILLRKKVIPFLSPIFLGVLIIELPFLAFEIRHKFLMINTIINSFNSPSEFQKLDIVADRLLEKVFNLFKGIWIDTVGGGDQIAGVVVAGITVLILVIFYKRFSVVEKLIIKTILITLSIFFIFFVFYRNSIWDHYAAGIPILYVLLLGACINLLYRVSKNYAIALFLLLTLLLININPIRKFYELNRSSWEGDTAVYRNQIAAIDYVYKEAQGENFKYIVYTPPVHDYPYRYLFKWYGEKNYRYVPKEEDARYLFVVIEPDFDYPDRIRQWLKIRENDGKIIKKERVKANIFVEKRILDNK